MARETRKASFEYALRDEGEGLTQYHGSFRRYGIELKVLEEYFPGTVCPVDISEMDKRRALRLYASLYWKHPGCDNLAPGLDYFIFDTGLVCGGPRTPASWLQLLAGPLGRTYEEAIEYANGIDLETAISGIEFYRRRRFKTSPLWGVLGSEWTNRTNRAKRRALELGRAATRELEVA